MRLWGKVVGGSLLVFASVFVVARVRAPRGPDLTRSSPACFPPYVFHRGGKPVRDFRKAWAAACKNAGVPGRLFHDLRRSAVRAMVRAGVPRSVAMEISGHETESTFERYNITDDRDRREALRRTQEFTDSQTRNLVSLPKN